MQSRVVIGVYLFSRKDVCKLLLGKPCKNENLVVVFYLFFLFFFVVLACLSTLDLISLSHIPSHTEYVTDEDINCVLKMLGSSWKELGKTLGFSQLELERLSLCSPSVVSAGKKMLQEWQALLNKNATFFALLGALEIIQRRDIADDLVSSRFVGT